MHKRKIRCCITITIVIILMICIPIKAVNKNLSSLIPFDSLNRITVEKTIENGSGTQSLGKYTLTEKEISEFKIIAENTKLKDIRYFAVNIGTDIRYYVQMEQEKGPAICNLKFYGNETLIVDCMYLYKEPFYGRYKIKETEFVDFFESIL